MKTFFKLIVVNTTGYEEYGTENVLGYFSTLEKAKLAIPKEEDMTHEYYGGTARTPNYDGIICIMECGLDDNQFQKIVWCEKPYEELPTDICWSH